ncbi:hypothetical protein NMY22_g13212 [Coprinellus aureogranulatus]|nr:hypothetical protein NMY22_g13212 [Coprinellus aureogranulatus]
MCTRFALYSANVDDSIKDVYSIEIVKWHSKDDFEIKYNIDYETFIPVLVQVLPGIRGPALYPMKWGMRRKKIKGNGEYLNLFTSMARTITNPAKVWQGVRQVGRCAVPCNGYFFIPDAENALPSYIYGKRDQLLLMAGFYELLPKEGEDENPGYGITIATTSTRSPYPDLDKDRPVFLTNKEDIEAWLDTSSKKWSAVLDDIVINEHNDNFSDILSVREVSRDIRDRKAPQSPHLIELYTPPPPAQPKPKATKSKSKATPSIPSNTLLNHGFSTTRQDASPQAGPSAPTSSQSQSVAMPHTPSPSRPAKRQRLIERGEAPSASSPPPSASPSPIKKDRKGKAKEKEIIDLTEDD